MKTTLTIQCLALIAFVSITLSCSNASKPVETRVGPKLFIKTMKVVADTRTDSITVFDQDYLEIGLYSANNGLEFVAKNTIEPFNTKDGKSYMQEITIVDENATSESKGLRFSNSIEFLNYMSLRGYEMVDQSKKKYRTDYTFKKKP